jgi:hypothetical protein
MGGDGSQEYSDFEVQTVARRFGGIAAGGNDDKDKLFQVEPVYPDSGIDSDELAELVAMFRTATVDNLGDGQVAAEYDLGLNLGERELPGRVLRAFNGRDTDSEGTVIRQQDDNNINEAGLEGNDAGILDTCTLIAGADDSFTAERFINFRHNFGTGPFVDKTDDVSFHMELEENGNTAGNSFQVVTYLYWDVTEQPGGRASFARP